MADENMGMAAQAAKNWSKITMEKNIRWMFDDYRFTDDDDRSLKDIYLEHGLNMTETLTLEQYLLPTERNETLKSILIEIPIGIGTRIWRHLTSPSWVTKPLISERLSHTRAFGDLFEGKQLKLVTHRDNNLYIRFDARTLNKMSGQFRTRYPDIPIKISHGKLHFIIPLVYVFPVGTNNRKTTQSVYQDHQPKIYSYPPGKE